MYPIEQKLCLTFETEKYWETQLLGGLWEKTESEELTESKVQKMPPTTVKAMKQILRVQAALRP